MTPPPDLNAWIDNFLYSCFAAFAGFMGHVFRTMDNKEKFKVLLSGVHGVCSGIVGLMTALLCKSLGMPGDMIFLCVGLMGWLGPEVSIHLLEGAVRSKLGFPRKESDD